MSCCACQTKPARITNLFRHEELKLKFFRLTNISIFTDTFICDPCTLQLDQSHNFREKCLEIHEISLKEIESIEDSFFDEANINDPLSNDEIIIYETGAEEYIEDDQIIKAEYDPKEEEYALNVLDSRLDFAIEQPFRAEKQRRIHTPQEKIDAIAFAEKSSNRQAAKVLKVDESCIRKWRRQKLESFHCNTAPEYEGSLLSSVVESDTEMLVTETVEVEGSEPLTSIKKRKSYSSGKKLEVVSYAEVTGNRQAAKFFSIDESCIRKWRINKDLLIKIHIERGTKRKPNLHWPDLDKALKHWTTTQMSGGKLLKPSEIKAKSIELAKSLNLLDFKGTSSYIFRFMERYRIPSRQAKKSVKSKR